MTIAVDWDIKNQTKNVIIIIKKELGLVIGPNCLQSLSANEFCRQRVNVIAVSCRLLQWGSILKQHPFTLLHPYTVII